MTEHDLPPLTRRGRRRRQQAVRRGDPRKSDLSLVVAETNNETENPIWHGEMHAIRRFYEIPAAERPAPRDCLFLARTSLLALASGITWSGFDNFYYLFSYEDTRDAFGIPHDIRILQEVYAVPDPDRGYVPAERPLYNRKNAFFTAHDIQQMIAGMDRSSRNG